MTETDIFVVNEELPRIEAVSFHDGFRVSVTWASGSRAGQSDVVDLGPDVFSYKMFVPLRDDPELFKTVHVINYGSAIGWSDGESLDMSAEGVEELAEQAMSPADFKAFLERHKLTQDAAAAQLGISRRQVNYYLTSKVIPRTVALACAFLDRSERKPVEVVRSDMQGVELLAKYAERLPHAVVSLEDLSFSGPEVAKALGILRDRLTRHPFGYHDHVFGAAYKAASVMEAGSRPEFALLDLRTLKPNEPLVMKK